MTIQPDNAPVANQQPDNEQPQQPSTWLDSQDYHGKSTVEGMPGLQYHEGVEISTHYVKSDEEAKKKRDFHSKKALFLDNTANLVRSFGSLTVSEVVQVKGDWQGGALSPTEIAERWRVRREDLLKHAEKWGARGVRELYRSRLSEGLVDPEGALGRAQAGTHGVQMIPRDKSSAIDRAVVIAVEVVREHKADVRDAREQVQALLTALSGAVMTSDEVREWCEIAAEVAAGVRSRDSGEQMTGARGWETRFSRALALFQKLTSLSTNAQIINSLTNALATTVKLERQAFGIIDDDSGADKGVSIEDRLREYAKAGGVNMPTPARSA